MSKMAVWESMKLQTPKIAKPVHMELSEAEKFVIDDHADRYLFFAGVGDYIDGNELETGALIARGLDGGRFTGHNLFLSRTLIPMIDVPVVMFGRDRPHAYNTDYPHQAEKPINQTVIKAAREVADDVVSMFKQFGVQILTSLTDLDADQAQSIFTTLLPLNFSPYVDYSVNKEGIIYGGKRNDHGTLANLRMYLQSESPKNLVASRLPPELKKKAKLCLTELVEASNRAYLHEKRVYDATIAELEKRRNTGVGKTAPDVRDYRYSIDLELAAPDQIAAETVAAYGKQAGEATANAVEKFGDIVANRTTDPELKEILKGQAQSIAALTAIVTDLKQQSARAK